MESYFGQKLRCTTDNDGFISFKHLWLNLMQYKDENLEILG